MGAKGYFEVNSGSDNYYFNACGPILGTDTSGVTCTTGGLSDPVALQSYGGGTPPSLPPETCAQLGSEATRQCTMSFPPSAPGTKAEPGLNCDFTGGAGGRSVSIAYKCSETDTEVKANQAGQISYTIEIGGPASCGKLPPPAPMSGGTLFLILFLVGCAAQTHTHALKCRRTQTRIDGVTQAGGRHGLSGAAHFSTHRPRRC